MRPYMVLLTLLLPAVSMAENRIGAGGAIMWGKDNTSTRGGSVIKSLDKPEDSFLRALPLFDINLSYKSGVNTYFLRTSTEAMTPGLQVGFKRQGFVFESTELYLGYNPLRRVWKDPYLLNTPREKTYQRDYELGVKFFQGASSLGVSSVYSDIEDDKLGERERDLRRDRLITELSYSYRYSLSKNLGISPSLNLRYSKAKGKANSYAGYTLGLSGIYRESTYLFNAGLGIDVDNYLNKDPVLLKKRKDTGYYLLVSMTKRNFIHKNVYFTSFTAYRQVNSNANFYDRKALFFGVLTGYSW